MTATKVRVAIVCMPFFSGARPAIQLGLLHAIVRERGFVPTSFHLNLDLAARIGVEMYEKLCNHRGRMTGEWLFSRAAFGDSVPPGEAYFDEFPDQLAYLREFGLDAFAVDNLRERVLPAYIEHCAESIDWSEFDVVGFTLTFQQTAASLALAARIKRRHSSVAIVIGGANAEGEMGRELMRSFNFLDFACSGEADESFPALLDCLAAGTIASVPGVVAQGTNIASPSAAPIDQLDKLPTPDYDEYFVRAAKNNLLTHEQYAWCLPFESSRGCWWGQKHHCTFCGLNANTMTFRAKSPERILSELQLLVRRHRITFFEATDNIMTHKHWEEFFGRIAEERCDLQFFYEVKANLSRAKIKLLFEGGVRWLQPGIESMSSQVLSLMRKGTTMLQNVRLLIWCRYYGIRVSWNLLWGFPQEKQEDYDGELEVLRLISHLEPPNGCGRIWLERYSPYFTRRDIFPVQNIRAERSYRHAFPSHVDVEKLAYFFDYEMRETLPDGVHAASEAWVDEWRRRWNSNKPDTLRFHRVGEDLIIDDDRGAAQGGTSHAFYGPRAAAYLFCVEEIRTASQIRAHLSATNSGPLTTEDIRATLDEFCSDGLMLRENDRYLALALPENPNW